MVNARAAVRQVHRPFGISGKVSQQIGPGYDYTVRLLAGTGDPPRDDHIPILTERATEGVARQRSRRTFLPRHDHPGVESTGQRHPDTLPAFEISWQVTSEYRF